MIPASCFMEPSVLFVFNGTVGNVFSIIRLFAFVPRISNLVLTHTDATLFHCKKIASLRSGWFESLPFV
jgi:hypothetical protein